jgi:hypothetical protein
MWGRDKCRGKEELGRSGFADSMIRSPFMQERDMFLETCSCETRPTLQSIRTSSPAAAIRGTTRSFGSCYLNYQSEQNLVRYDRLSTSITADLCAYCFLTSSRSKAWEGPEWQSWWRTWNREGVISTTRVSLLHYVSVFLQSRTRWVFWQIYVTGFLTPVEIVEFYWQVTSARTPVCYQIPCQNITNTYSFACRCSITRRSSC